MDYGKIVSTRKWGEEIVSHEYFVNFEKINENLLNKSFIEYKDANQIKMELNKSIVSLITTFPLD